MQAVETAPRVSGAKSKTSNVKAIVGGVIGAAAFLALAAIVALLLVKCRRRRSSPHSHSKAASPLETDQDTQMSQAHTTQPVATGSSGSAARGTVNGTAAPEKHSAGKQSATYALPSNAQLPVGDIAAHDSTFGGGESIVGPLPDRGALHGFGDAAATPAVPPNSMADVDAQ